MLRKIILPTILGILAYGFWISPDFKEIAAGVAIFLFGMLSLEEGFKVFSGGTLEKILQKSTDKLYKSIGFGVLATTIMQSSSLVSVLTISFLGAGLIGLAQGIGIVFGANIGTTTGAWLVAGFGLKVKISAYAMPMLVFGVILIFQKAKSLKGIGYILAGLGFLFLGIHYMKDGFEAFKSTIDLAAFGGTGLKYLFIFTGIGIFATVVMQSSHATLVLIITALAVGQISYENALALAIGANVGTTITAILGAMSSNIVGKRLAGAHLIFNVTTGLIAIIFMSQIMFSVDWISNIVGIANDDYTLKLAVFHTIFNVIGVLVMVPFIGKLVTFLESFLKDKKEEENAVDTAKYLNESALELPLTSLEAIRRETKHLYSNAFEIIADSVFIDKDYILGFKNLEEVILKKHEGNPIKMDEYYDQKILGIYNEIVDYSSRAQSGMSQIDIIELNELGLANRDIKEAVKDIKHIRKNLKKYSIINNEHIRKEYGQIRTNIATLLYYINLMSKVSDQSEISTLIERVKVYIENNDAVQNNTLHKLIEKKLISNEMATSLMDNTNYVNSLVKHLLKMARIVYTRD
ncbi:MAG: Na/Pi cotransporter family protein, partial [Flavobacteriaceae bacterium]|nr:Na/Pi cotransporter family protein [Flavobacteriaceae bacterium]